MEKASGATADELFKNKKIRNYSSIQRDFSPRNMLVATLPIR